MLTDPRAVDKGSFPAHASSRAISPIIFAIWQHAPACGLVAPTAHADRSNGWQNHGALAKRTAHALRPSASTEIDDGTKCKSYEFQWIDEVLVLTNMSNGSNVMC